MLFDHRIRLSREACPREWYGERESRNSGHYRRPDAFHAYSNPSPSKRRSICEIVLEEETISQFAESREIVRVLAQFSNRHSCESRNPESRRSRIGQIYICEIVLE